MELSLSFEDNRTWHKDLILRFAGEVYICDADYLALDYNLLPDQEDSKKIRVVLHRRLEQWQSDVTNIEDVSGVDLPYDFWDRYTGWLRCVRSGTTASVCRGWTTEVEGYSIWPSDVGPFLTDVPGFRPDGPTVSVPMTELIEAVKF